MGFGSGKQGKEPVLEQQCLPGSQVHTAPAAVMGSPNSAIRKRKVADSGKQLGRAAESAASQSREVKASKIIEDYELKEQVMRGRVWAKAEGFSRGLG